MLHRFAYLALITVGISWLAAPAKAVPAFADQTGQSCSACHVGGFGPQLTSFGRQFKLEGYTANTGTFTVPVSAMAIASYVHTQSDQAGPPAPQLDNNDNFYLDEASIFLAGHIGDHVGGFVQTTYEGLGHHWGWDNVDVRAMTHVTADGSDVLVGVSLNNSPTTQDVYNSLPAWGFQYTDSDMAPAPAAGTVVGGALAQAVIGGSVYALWDSHIYTEVGLYGSPSDGFLKSMGVDPTESGTLDGAAPYLRAAYQDDDGKMNWEVGAFAFFPRIFPGDDSSAGSDHYTDIGVDASLQYTEPGGDAYTVNARYTHEHQSLDASTMLGLALRSGLTLQEVHVDASYYWQNKVGFTVSPFATWGSSDPLLYMDNRTFSPNSDGVMFQVDYTPWGDDPPAQRLGLRVGLQYTAYAKFDGASSNYDGTGRDASDNNTLRVFLWSAF
ncbi:MAG: cytochrome C [Alphaproteobacteria bacterium]|nr:cytochrome C [Alphaproteobacteria bacterium]